MRRRIFLFPLLVLLLLAHTSLAKDEWISVKSRNFDVIGNAKEKDIKAVVSRLEQFRHVFGLLFPKIRLTDAAETNVIVFKDGKSFKPFLPKRPDGKPDDDIAGYFLSHDEVNYIVLSTEGQRAETYKTIFHEYVHYLLKTNFDRSSVPAWLNEGLAEYYSTFDIEDDQVVYLGNLREDHLAYLSRSSLMPLRQFFSIDSFSLHKNGNHSRSVYYAQAWALIHYFAVQQKIGELANFIELSKNGADPEEAFNKALGISYDTMQTNLKAYVEQRKFTRLVARFSQKLVFDSDMSVRQLDDSSALAYKGDLLYRKREFIEAEALLTESLELDPDNARANTAMGMIKMHLKEYDAAKQLLAKAIAGSKRTAFSSYSYAYLLSREGMNEQGLVRNYSPENVKKMTDLLRQAIAANPNFAASYHLLAFINIVNNENLEESLGYMNKAIELQPGNDVFLLMKAQIYLRQEKLDEVEKIATSVMLSVESEEVRSQAKYLLNRVESIRKAFESRREYEREIAKQAGVDSVTLVERKSLTPEQIEEMAAEREISRMNNSLQVLQPGEKRILGYIEKVSCKPNLITYTIRTDGGPATLTSKDFQGLDLLSVSEDTYDAVLSCKAELSKTLTVFTYTPSAADERKGTVRAMTFVPQRFRFKTDEEIKEERRVVIINR